MSLHVIRAVWQRARKFVPPTAYPLLAPVYRWERRQTIRALEAADAAYRRADPSVVAPGAELRFNVVGAVDIPRFLDGGRQTASDLDSALRAGGGSMEGVRTALDFGCGCGRLLLAARDGWPAVRWFGCDVDGRAVAWCRENLAGVTVEVNAELPPLGFDGARFDLIWCGSVFTHLDEARQDAWLGELTGRLAPGGYLVASVYGERCWSDLPGATIRRIRERGIVFARTGGDEGIHPAWYQTAWHTREYVERHWSQFGSLTAWVPAGFGGYQDVAVLRVSSAR